MTVDAAVVYGLSILGSSMVAVVFHTIQRSFTGACKSTAITVVLVCFIAESVASGRIDGWWLVVIWTLGALAYFTSYAVGWLMDRFGLSARTRR